MRRVDSHQGDTPGTGDHHRSEVERSLLDKLEALAEQLGHSLHDDDEEEPEGLKVVTG